MEHLFDLASPVLPSPIVGKVVAVHAKQTAQNPQDVTLYDVEIYPRSGIGALTLPPCPYAPSASGGAIETEEPLTEGESVLVSFLEGDVDRPFILSRYVNLDTASDVSQAASEAPHYRKKVNGLKVSVAKDGTTDLTLPQGKVLTLRNEAGAVLLRVLESGDIELGGASLRALVTEDFYSALANAFTLAAVAPGDGGLALKTALSLSLLDPLNPAYVGNTKTTKVKAQ